MERRLTFAALTCWLLIGLAMFSVIRAQDAASPAVAAEKSKPTFIKVEQRKFVVETTIKGTVESDQATELRLDMKAWPGPHVVKSAAPHGARVKKGQVVLDAIEQLSRFK